MQQLLPDEGEQSKFSFRNNIVLLGLVSMFVDMSTEMVYAITPLFLVALGAAPALIGIIEGISESIAAFLKVFAGYFSDKTNKKKPLTIVGYGSAIVYKIGLLLSASWVGVLIAKIIDRTGKGVRVAPRDSLIAESGGKTLGKSFGLHKMFDMLGSALGVGLAIILLYQSFEYKTVFAWSILPAALGIVCLFFVKETADKPKSAKQKVSLSLKNVKLGKKIWLYLATVFIFSVGNSSNAFLLLKARGANISDTEILIVYLLFNLSASILVIPFGKLSDKFGRKPFIVAAYVLYGLVYLGFAFLLNHTMAYVLFITYGAYSALLSGTEKALVVELSPSNLKGTVLGLQGMAQGVGLLVSSVIAGLLWQFLGSNFPFYFGAAMAFIAAILAVIVFKLKDDANKNFPISGEVAPATAADKAA